MTDAVVLGRVGVDLTPPELETSLEAASSFIRAIGGYGGNVSVGLARLGVPVALVAGVGDDGHASYVRSALAAEGVDVGPVAVQSGRRTQVAFFEAWPPETFPVTFHRDTPAPETLLTRTELEAADLPSARLVLVSGGLFAEEPARSALLRALADLRAANPHPIILLDLDWRPTFWADHREAREVMRRAIRLADVVIGSDHEFAACELDPGDALGTGCELVALKHGSGGSSTLSREGTLTIEAIRVEVVCALGAGDAFAAAFADGILRGDDPATSLARANAAGAIVASRLFCSSAMPRAAEIDALLAGRLPATAVGA